MTKDRFMFSCDVYGRAYQHGPHRYEGHRLALYGNAFCCDSCWTGNWDGWGPREELKLLGILKEKNLPTPQRNEKGWLPRA